MNELYSDYQVRRISPEGQDFFFGYYDINAYDKGGKRHLCNIPPFIDKIPEKEDVLKLGIIDIETGGVDVFAETTAWNFQQGALLQWHNTKENVVFYNERNGNEYVTVQHNLSTGEKTYSPAAANISKDGKYGLGISFNRIFDFRPGYGYAGVADRNYSCGIPEDDGVFLINIEQGTQKLILNYKDMLKMSGLKEYDDEKFLINHITFNPSGEKFLLLLRNFPKPKIGWNTTMMISDTKGNAYTLLLETFISHYYWLDNDNIVVYCNVEGKGGVYIINSVTGEKREIISEYFQDNRDDIHCIASPDGRYIIGDCYPFKSPWRKVFLIDMKTEETREILRAGTIIPKYDDIRCDLHVRWRPDGKAFSFDSTHTGRREIYELEFEAASGGTK